MKEQIMNVLILAALMGSIAAGASSPGPQDDSSWLPAECELDSTTMQARAEFVTEMEGALPSSAIYVPTPFPKKDADILKDFRHQYLKIWQNTPSDQVPAEEQSVLRGVRNGELKYKVERVTSWNPSRCKSNRPKNLYYLIRIYEENREIARFTLNESGLWAAMALVPSGKEQQGDRWAEAAAFLTPSDALKEVQTRYRLEGSGAQFVHTGGGTVRCFALDPCVAFRSGERMYLLDSSKWGALYEFTSSSRSFSIDDFNMEVQETGDPMAVVRDVSQDEGLISVGSGWVFGRKVPAQSE